MKAKILAVWVFLVCSSATQVLACPFCYGAKTGKSAEHMAIAIWFLFGAVMSVLGGIGAFTLHIWRHSRAPLEPHQKLAEETFDEYE